MTLTFFTLFYRVKLVYVNGGSTRSLVNAVNPLVVTDFNQKYVCQATNLLRNVSAEYTLNGMSVDEFPFE